MLKPFRPFRPLTRPYHAIMRKLSLIRMAHLVDRAIGDGQHFKWIAMDADGKVWLFADYPEWDGAIWLTNNPGPNKLKYVGKCRAKGNRLCIMEVSKWME